MAEDISTLVLRVQSDGIKDGTDQLNALTEAASNAEGATKRLGTQVAQTEAASTKASGSAKAMAEAEDTVTRAVGAVTTAYQRKSVEQKRELELFNQSGKAYAQAQADAAKMNAAIDRQTTSYDSMWNAAQRMNAEFDKRAASKAAADFDKAWESAQRLNKAYDDNVQAYGRMQSKALEMNKAWDENKDKVDKNTGAHGSNAAAIREVMVLMHELSQGSMKRFGSSAMVLINQMDAMPKAFELIKSGSWGVVGAWAVGITTAALLAGAIGAVAFGMIQGAREQKAFNDALLMTGGYAGVTADQLHNMAVEASKVGGTVGVAKEAVTQLAASGKFTADQIKSISTTASLMDEAFGVPISKTIQEFEELSTRATTSTARSTNEITQHVLKLNDQYHVLTAAQLDEISTLEKAGQARAAVDKADELFSAEQNRRAKESIQNLGYVARAYTEIKSAISGMMDSIGSWGAKSTTQSELERQKSLRESAANNSNVKGANRIAVLKMFDDEIAKLEAKMRGENLEAQKKGDAQQLEQDKIHAGERLRVLVEANDKEAKTQRQLADFDADLTLARITEQDKLTAAQKKGTKAYEAELENQKTMEKAYALARQKITDDGVIKVKGDDTRTTDRDAEIDHIKSTNLAKLDAIQGFLSASKELARKEGDDRKAELAVREGYYQDERDAIAAALKKELAVYDSFKGKTKEERAVNGRKRQAAVDGAGSQTTAVDRAEQTDINNVRGEEYQELDKLDKKYQQTYQAEAKRIADLVAAEKLRLSGIEDVKSAKMDAQADKEDSTADDLQREYDLRHGMIDLMQETGLWDSRRAAVEESGLASLKNEIAGRRELADIHRQEAEHQRGTEDFQRTTKYLNTAIAAGKAFEKALTQAFGNVGKAIGGMSVAFLDMMKSKNDAQAYYNSLSDVEQKKEENKKQLQDAQTTATIGGYANMAEAAKGFFDSKSKGALIAEGISKGLHVAEMARNAYKIVSNLATGASAMFAQSGWGGFAGVAAMAAVMAAFGVSVASSSNSGGMSAADMQKTQGTGSVFGDMGTTDKNGNTTYKTQSDSITKAMDVLKNNSNAMLPVNEAMLKSLQNIEAAMTGLTNLVVRSVGVTDGTNMGIQTGTLQRGAEGIVGATANAIKDIPIFGAIGAKLAAFWGKTTQSIVDSGLQYGGTVGNLKSGSGYNQYASVDTTSSSWFGLSKSTTNNVQTQGLSAELSQQFGLIFSGLEDSMKSAASALGKDGDAVGKAIDSMVIDTTKISLKGLSGDDLTKAINAVISKTMDDIAQTAFPQMDAFRQVGEGYAQTVVRVASGIEQANVALKTLGITAISYLDIQNKTGDVGFEMVQQSIELKEAGSGVGQMVEYITGTVSDLTKAYTQLVAIRGDMQRMGLGSGLNSDTVTGAGGQAALGTALDTFKSQYYTAAEQVTMETDRLTAAFADAGKALPESRTQLRSWIEAAAAAGDQMEVGKLLSLADAFDKLQTSAASAGTTLSADADVAKKAADAAISAAESAFTRLQASVSAQKDIITKQQTATQTVIDNLKSMLSNVANAIKVTAPTLSDANAFKKAMEVVKGAIQDVQSGADVSQLNGLDDALSTLSSNKDTAYSTAVEYALAQAQANAALTELQNSGQGQLSAAERQLDIETQQLAALDNLLTAAQVQIDALKGIDSTVLSVTQALSLFQGSVGTAAAAKAVSDATTGSTGVSGQIESLYQSLLGRASDAPGKAYWTNAALNQGASMDTIASDFMNSSEYKASHPNLFPSFDVGTNYVPSDMLANIHQGERIIPAADNTKLMQALNNTSVGDDNASLIQKIDDLIEVIQTGDVANVQKTNEMFKIVREWNLNGMPQVRQQQ